MINPVFEIGRLCKKYGKLLFVDCVSAAAGEHIDVVQNNIAVCTSVGGKCLGAFPGSAYVCARKDVLDHLTADQCKSVYLSLYKHYQCAITSRQTPNTPNVTLFWSLNFALTNVLEEETLEGRIARYQRCASIIRNGLRSLGLRMLLDEHLSNTVTSVFLPEGVDAGASIAAMEEKGYTFYLGKGDYAKHGMIQIANMGEIYEQDCHAMLEAFRLTLADMAKA
ncbi:MAG: 2-aminoethylphosphonate--pyruvate transaminase [Firmicutes bacterium ADurb.Bin248]|nr:MAG: 2-aminoethylphosphonate--pyruvate transaminase [Firmicutes bacterium ADurb.Bin248]